MKNVMRNSQIRIKYATFVTLSVCKIKFIQCKLQCNVMYKYMHSTVTEINYITFPKELLENCCLNIIHARKLHF
jgi:hypothetical protein